MNLNQPLSDEEMIKTARDDVKMYEAKRLGLDIDNPRKFQLQIKALGHNVS